MVTKKIIVTIDENILEEFDKSIEYVDRSKVIEALARIFLKYRKDPDTNMMSLYLQDFKELNKENKSNEDDLRPWETA